MQLGNISRPSSSYFGLRDYAEVSKNTFQTYTMPYRPIVLHKIEWDRLRSQANPPQEPQKEDNQYLKSLIEKSQEWIKSWPDTFEGQVELLQKQKKKDHAKGTSNGLDEIIKQRKLNETKQAIAKARQLVFQGSCYGKQLLSALIASKVIEEREAQIAFNKQIKKQELELEKEKNNEELYFCKLDQEKRDRLRRKKNVMFANENKDMYETLNAKLKKDKEEEACLEREDAALMKKLLDYEKQEAEKVKKCQEEEVRKNVKEQQEFREAKLRREIENDAKIEKANTENCRLRMKMRQAQKQFFIDELNKIEARKQNYKIIEEMERNKRKRFEEFVEKAVKKHEETISKKEQEDLVKQAREREEKHLLIKQARSGAERNQSRDNRTCERQCLIVNSHSERHAKKQKKLCQCTDQPIPKSPERKLQFLIPQKKLIEQLREREKEPSPWTGQSGVHAQFAQEAAKTLAECKHKNMARKVVDEYRRLNCFDATTLPVQNY